MKEVEEVANKMEGEGSGRGGEGSNKKNCDIVEDMEGTIMKKMEGRGKLVEEVEG